MSVSRKDSYHNMFPPAPNWYSSQLSAYCLSLEIFVYAARNAIFCLDANNFKYLKSLTGHSQRVNSVVIYGTTVVSAGADKSVRCWDLESGAAIGLHDFHKAEVFSLACVEVKEYVISGDKTGQIIVWQQASNRYRRTSIVPSAVYCLESSQMNDKDVIAIGYQNGSIIIATVTLEEEMMTLYRLRGHDDEIHSLAWMPFNADDTNTIPSPILASGSRDKTIRLWDVESENTTKTLSLPKAKGHFTEQQKSRIWITVTWSHSNKYMLMSSSYMGDLLLWNIKDKKPTFEKFDEAHSRCIFKINIMKEKEQAITISMDRQVILWDLRSRSVISTLPCLGGFVYSLDISANEPKKVAIGVGDNTIRIWTYSKTAGSSQDSILLWKGLKAKITCVKWHPSQEGILAYGTDTGNIGFMDVYSQTNTVFKSYHKGVIYALDWGPDIGSSTEGNNYLEENNKTGYNSKNKLCLYSCGDNIILMSDQGKPARASVDLAVIIPSRSAKPMNRSEIAFHPFFEYFAFGNADGSIEIYHSLTQKLVYWFNGHRGCINRFSWQQKGIYLASGSEDGTVGIHDLSDINNYMATNVSVAKSSCHRLLKAHSKGITDISWHPSDMSKLLSTSSDGSAIVWDIPKSQPIARFLGHYGRVLSCAWSLVADDEVLTGGDDLSVCIWNWHSWPFTDPPEHKKKNAKLQSKTSIGAASTLTVLPQKNTSDSNIHEESEPPLGSMGESSTFSALGDTGSQSLGGKKHRRSNKKSKSNLLPSSTMSFLNSPRKELQRQCFQLAEQLYGGSIKAMIENLQLEDKLTFMDQAQYNMEENGEGGERGESNISDLIFGSRVDVKKMVNLEYDGHAKNTSSNNVTVSGIDLDIPLDIWKGDCSAFVSEAMKNDDITMQDWISLALSPMAGRDVWAQLMRRQATKMANIGDYHGAAMCFLACSSVYDAIEVYRAAKLYREAIALAKIRLPPQEPMISELLVEWATQLELKGLYEQASKCYLASQVPSSISSALNALARRHDPSALLAAACLAKLVNDPSSDERWDLYRHEMELRGMQVIEIEESTRELNIEDNNTEVNQVQLDEEEASPKLVTNEFESVDVLKQNLDVDSVTLENNL